MSVLLGNAIVGQSGGPTAALNATLFGVIEASLENSDTIKTLYGMKNGIEGFLREDIIDLFSFFEDKDKLGLLPLTPSAALGSCRFRLEDADRNENVYRKIFAILEKYGIKYFFYIGGNDSMDTVSKLFHYGEKTGSDVRFIGIPKTVDNDLVITDHTPGFGSCAKYIVTTVEELLRDRAVYSEKTVTLVEVMGRDTGWLAACASLCGKANCGEVDFIYIPERPFNPSEFILSVKKALLNNRSVMAVISEGIKYENGEYVSASDGSDEFGHSTLGGAARYLCALVSKEIGCKSRAIELNLPQRCASHILSKTDIEESIKIGKSAVNYALCKKSGKMVCFLRKSGKSYGVKIKCVSLSAVANKVKYMPSRFINGRGDGVTQECKSYLAPLVCGELMPPFKDGLPVFCIIKALSQ